MRISERYRRIGGPPSRDIRVFGRIMLQIMGQATHAGGRGGPLRRLPVGAEVKPDGNGVHFRVWAPAQRGVEVAIEGGPGRSPEAVALAPEGDGYFSGEVAGAAAG